MTAKTFDVLPSGGRTRPEPAARASSSRVVLFVVLLGTPITVVPAGHVGVKDFFGSVSSTVLPAGVHLVLPFTRVVKMSIQTQEVKETAEVPSKEGLTMDLEGSLLYRLDPAKAAEVYKTVGRNYAEIVVVPQIRSAIREITASYEAKALYSAEREKIARETFELFKKMSDGRGDHRGGGAPAQDRPAAGRRERDPGEVEARAGGRADEVRPPEGAQEAERKRIEAQGIADFQRIVASGISPQLLEWKGIEATEKLAMSPNAKVVVIGNPKSGLPIILGGGSDTK